MFRLEQFLSTSGSYQATLLGKATTVGGCRVEEITTMTSAQGRSDWIGSGLEINVSLKLNQPEMPRRKYLYLYESCIQPFPKKKNTTEGTPDPRQH